MSASTPATSVLDQAGVPYTEHTYTYLDLGGTAEAARQLEVDEHLVVKTLIMVDNHGEGHVVLMHGDRRVGLKALARQVRVKSIAPAAPGVATRLSGYQIGGISPLGTRTIMPVWAESSVLDLETIYLNGGRRGYLVALSPAHLCGILNVTPVTVALT